MWKTNETDPARGTCSPYNVWAAISKDGGAIFSKPLKITKTDSPAAPQENAQDYWNGNVGDHGPSGMAIDDVNQTAYLAWGDWTPGERTIIFSAVDLEMFEQ